MSDVLGHMLGRLIADARPGGGGPVKRCKRCGREHPTRRPCDLTTVMVPAKSGRMVERQVHASRVKYEPRR